MLPLNCAITTNLIGGKALDLALFKCSDDATYWADVDHRRLGVAEVEPEQEVVKGRRGFFILFPVYARTALEIALQIFAERGGEYKCL